MRVFHSPFIERQRRWCIFSIMILASMISCFHQVGLSTVSGEVGASLGVDGAGLGLLTAALSYSYAAMQIPAGLLSDTLGARKSVTAALLLAGAGTLLFAVTESPAWAIVSRALIGAGVAVVAVPFMKLIAIWFPAGAFGRLTAVSFSIGGLGYFLASSPMAYAATMAGWRAVYLLLAALTILCAALVWVIVRDGENAVPAPKATEPGITRLKTALRHILAEKQLWLLGFWYFCQGGIYFAFIGLWAGQFLTKGLGLSVRESGLVLSLSTCSLFAAPLFTWVTARCGSPRTVLIWLSLGTTVLSIPLVLGLPKLPMTALALYLLAYSITALGGGAAVFFAAVKELFDVKYAGTATGFANIFPFLGGAALQQLIGLLTDAGIDGGADPHRAFSNAFAALAVAAALSALLAFLLRKPATR